MTTSSNSESELLTEHFGYPPVSLIDDIINSVNILADRAFNSIEQGLLNAPPASLGFKPPKPHSKSSKTQQQKQPPEQDEQALSPAERVKNEVEAGTHQLETLLCASVDRNFDKFELYVLRNIFTVRPAELCNWIRLSHYDGLDFASSSRRRRKSRRRLGANGDGDGDVSAEAQDGQQHETREGDDDEVVEGESGDGGDGPTIQSVTALRRRLRESMRLNALLTAERTRNEALLSDLRRLVGAPSASGTQVKEEGDGKEGQSPGARRRQTRSGANDGIAIADGIGLEQQRQEGGEQNSTRSPFAFLHQKGDLASSGGGAAAPLATTAAFTLSQMQALRALSSALSHVAPDLGTASGQNAEDREHKDEDVEGPNGSRRRGWRRERVEYVETATRRHLETVHGLELGSHGEVRDGEWQGPGRSLARGEVEGLERIVALLGGDGDGERNRSRRGSGSGSARGSATRRAPAGEEDSEGYGQVEGDEGERMDLDGA
ncbi:Mis12 protein-domain-containing protein [Astrocystis sublimbata]|nr:Mis12 protein-domain-containing protein [Astrocystis sublimbata]